MHGHGHAVMLSSHPADKYLPFVWSCFFYILLCNLLGAIPFLGSATGEINVTGALAVHGSLCHVYLWCSGDVGEGVLWEPDPETGVPGPGGALLAA